MNDTEVSSNSKRLDKSEAQPLTWMFWRKRRYIVVLLAHLGYFSNYSLRVNLSVAIVEMTKNRTVEHEDGTITVDEKYFDWSSQERGLILSSFFWGYIVTQFAGGFFGKRFGGNLIFGLGIGLTAVLSIITPWLGRTVTAMIVIRVLQGLCEGVTFPCIQDVWLYWAPIPERSRMASIAYAGMYIGTVVTMPISGLLATYLGWESIFYVFGVIGVLWHITWMIIVRSSPDKDRFISTTELDYIRSNVSVVEKHKPIPWASLLKSKPVYAITASHTAENWGYYTMITQMPMFLADTLNYNLGDSGFLSAAPYLTMAIFISVAGYLADILQNKGWLTTTQVRRYFNCGAFVVQFVCLLMAGFLVDRVWSVVLIIIGVGSGGFAVIGFAVNPLDIAPAFASVVLGFSNTFATLPGIISPVLSGFLVQNQVVDEWRMVFYITAGIYVFGCIVYWFWSSGKLQPWAISKSDDVSSSKKDTE